MDIWTSIQVHVTWNITYVQGYFVLKSRTGTGIYSNYKIAADIENKKMDVDLKCGKYGSILDKMGCNRRQVKSKPTFITTTQNM